MVFNLYAHCRVLGARMNNSLRGGFVEKHDGRIVNKFKSNGQAFLLSAGQSTASGVKAARESDAVEDVLDLIENEKRTMSV